MKEQVQALAQTIVDEAHADVIKMADQENKTLPSAEDILAVIQEIKVEVMTWINEEKQNNTALQQSVNAGEDFYSILKKTSSSMITDKRRHDIHSKLHKLQSMLLAAQGRTIRIKNVRLAKNSVIVYDLDTANLTGGNHYKRIQESINGLKIYKKEDTSLYKNLNATYRSVDEQYSANKSGSESSYVFWRTSKQGKNWSKIKILNRGSLAEIYLKHFYAGQQDVPTYDKNFQPIIPSGYNMFFYGQRGRIASDTELFHKVTNEPGFLTEDIDLGNGEYIGVKFGSGYNIYKIANLLKSLQSLETGLRSKGVLESISDFEGEISKAAKNSKTGKSSESHQVVGEVVQILEKKSKKEIEELLRAFDIGKK